MPRTRRDYAAEYRRRVARAEAKGLSRQEARGHKPPKRGSEYQQRVRRYRRRYPEAGKKEAGGRDPERAKRRREDEADISGFLDALESNDIIMLSDHISTIKRDANGEWEPHQKRVLPADETRDVQEFNLPAMSDERLQRLVDQELQTGAMMTPIPSLDQSRLQ